MGEILVFAFIEGLVAIVEMLAFIAEGALWLVDLLCMVFDLVAWIRGRPNRVARRAARKSGEDVPPRDVWNRRVIILSALVVIITITLFLLRR